MMKKITYLILIGTLACFSCKKGETVEEEIDFGDWPESVLRADYPELPEGTNSGATYIINGNGYENKRVRHNGEYGIGYGGMFQNWNIYIINANGSKSISLELKSVEKGTYDESEYPQTWLNISVDDVYYNRSKNDPSTFYTIKVVGNDGKEVWGAFRAKMLSNNNLAPVTITEGKFSARIGFTGLE